VLGAVRERRMGRHLRPRRRYCCGSARHLASDRSPVAGPDDITETSPSSPPARPSSHNQRSATLERRLMRELSSSTRRVTLSEWRSQRPLPSPAIARGLRRSPIRASRS
jgi:hypothetical protein